jgi:hypothetical protein
MSRSPRYLFVDPDDIISHNPSFCKNVPRTTIALIPLGSSNARSIKKGQIFHENLPPKAIPTKFQSGCAPQGSSRKPCEQKEKRTTRVRFSFWGVWPIWMRGFLLPKFTLLFYCLCAIIITLNKGNAHYF